MHIVFLVQYHEAMRKSGYWSHERRDIIERVRDAGYDVKSYSHFLPILNPDQPPSYWFNVTYRMWVEFPTAEEAVMFKLEYL